MKIRTFGEVGMVEFTGSLAVISGVYGAGQGMWIGIGNGRWVEKGISLL